VIVLAAEFLKSATDARGWPPPGPPELAFCGRSNVGKSSALNALAARKSLARVSRTPGRTRLINFFDVRAAEKTVPGDAARSTTSSSPTCRVTDTPPAPARSAIPGGR